MTTALTQHIDRTRKQPEHVLVLGSTGMLGRSWVQLLEREGIKHQALSRPEFDLSDPESIIRALPAQNEYDLVVNAAAWTDVDGAEEDEAGAEQSNGYAVEQIAQRCLERNTLLITYSTDYVFSGQSTAPFPIDAPIAPLNAYGRSKALGELLLRQSTPNHLLIRTSWVYAPWGKNFVLTMKQLMHDRDRLRVVDDQQGRPTCALELAANSLKLFRAGAIGTWHLTDEGECTWFRLAQEIKSTLDAGCVIEPCNSSEFPRPAQRPTYSTLDIEPTIALIGPFEPWQSRVRDVLEQTQNSGT